MHGTKTKVEFRPMVANHLDGVLPIARLDPCCEIRTVDNQYRWSMASRLLQRLCNFDNVAGIVALNSVALCGYIIWERMTYEREIMGCAVHPSVRRQGIGSALCEHVPEDLPQIASVRESNLEGEAFMKTLGFRFEEYVDEDFTAPEERGLFMANHNHYLEQVS